MSTDPEKLVQDFVQRLRQVAADNLISVVVYGSAAGGSFDPESSNLNLMCVLKQTAFAELRRLSPAIDWWTKQKHPAPLVLSREELVRSADVFAIEFLDMKRQHRIVFGEDPVVALEIPMHLHRAQVEYELREKLILLRQRLMLSDGREEALWSLMAQSLPAFTTLMRHALIALGDTGERSKKDALGELAKRLHFDAASILELIDIRERKKDRKGINAADLCARYLDAIQQVTAGVDKLLDAASARSGSL